MEPGGRGNSPPQILADQLSLSLGGQIMLTTLMLQPPEFSDLPTALNNQCDKTRLEKAFSPRLDFKQAVNKCLGIWLKLVV